MSVWYVAANLKKRQFIAPFAFGDPPGAHNYGHGWHATALVFLTSLDAWCRSSLAGSWAGDSIQFLHDSLPPDTHGFKTATEDDPRRNLYGLVKQEFEDISVPSLAMICDGLIWAADDLVSRLENTDPDAPPETHDFLLYYLGEAALDFGCSRLDDALRKAFGSDWRGAYTGLRKYLDEMDADD